MILQKWWLPISAIFLMAITIASFLPVSLGSSGEDKFWHIACYAALVFPSAYAAKKHPLYFAAFFLVWSGCIELIQPYFDRSAEWRDLFVNGIGLALGLIAGLLARSIMKV